MKSFSANLHAVRCEVRCADAAGRCRVPRGSGFTRLRLLVGDTVKNSTGS